jgi:hypothetical protein
MSANSEWRRFVKHRRVDLRDVYPCSVPTRRRICPKHRSPIGRLSGICKPCRDEFYERLAAEHVAERERRIA